MSRGDVRDFRDVRDAREDRRNPRVDAVLELEAPLAPPASAPKFPLSPDTRGF